TSAVVTAQSSDNTKKLVAYVCPTTDYLDDISNAFNDDNLDQWTRLFEDQYAETHENNTAPLDLNLVGWNSSYTSEFIAEEQMREWIAGTVQRINALNPQKLLEIGCGTGLLLYRYAEACKSVHALDISAAALSGVRREVNRRGWSHVTLAQGDALS